MIEMLLSATKKGGTGGGLPAPKYQWKFNSDFKDSGPLANHATPTNATIATYKGRAALYLPSNAYVTIGAFALGSGPWTISLWLLGIGWGGYSHLFSALVQADFALKVGRTMDGIGGRMYAYTAATGSKIANTAMALDTWYQLTVTFAGGTLKYYRDGVLIDTFSNVAFNSPNTQYRIGFGNAGEYTNGYQADTRIYDVALDADQVSALYVAMQ